MLLPDELGPVMILTLPCDSELWKELATNTGEHSSNSGCLENRKIRTFINPVLHSHIKYPSALCVCVHMPVCVCTMYVTSNQTNVRLAYIIVSIILSLESFKLQQELKYLDNCFHPVHECLPALCDCYNPVAG